MNLTSNLDQTRIRNQRMLLGNPLRGLTPEMLGRYLDSFNSGQLRDAARTWDLMERRSLMLGAVARKRYNSISRLDWQILKQEESPEAEAQAEFLDQFWRSIVVSDAMERDRKGGVRMLLRQAAFSIGHRYSVHEIVWKPEPGRLSATFTRVPLWFFENTTGTLRFLEGDFSLTGVDLAPGGWLVHVGDGLMEATSIAISQSGLAFGDFLAYSEKFGMPGLVVKTGATPGSPEWQQAEEAASKFGQDWAAVFSKDTDVDTIEVGGAQMPQERIIELLQRQIIVMWLGSDLATISGGNASGASLQGDQSEILLQDDIEAVVEPLREQVERIALEWRFGVGVRQLARLNLIMPNKEASSVDLAVDRFLVEAGVRLPSADAAERYGRRMADPEEKDILVLPQAGAAPGAGLPTLANEQAQGADAVAKAVADVMAPVRDRLAQIAQLTDPTERREALLELRAELPERLRAIKMGSTAVRAFERSIGAALVSGLLTTQGSN